MEIGEILFRPLRDKHLTDIEIRGTKEMSTVQGGTETNEIGKGE